MPNLKTVIGWATVDPTSGSGNGQVSVSTAAPYTGRVARKQTFQFVGTGVDAPINRVVNQKGIPEFVDLQANASVDKTGGTLTVTGTSNSPKLTFELAVGENPLTLVLPANYTAGGVETANGVAITGDPGASAEYQFGITFTGIPTNGTVTDLTTTLKVTADGGMTDSCPITQTAGDPVLSVSPEEITLEADGTAQVFNVTGNTAWTVKAAASNDKYPAI